VATFRVRAAAQKVANAMLPRLPQIQEVAVLRAACPISLEDLRLKPNQVGAFVRNGQRVEPALYHQSSVQLNNGTLIIEDGCSPLSLERVDGFMLMPALSKCLAASAWGEFVEFIDWDQDEWVFVQEVSTALAAILPLNEDKVERYIRDHFEVDRDGCLTCWELEVQVLPYLADRIGEFLVEAASAEAPELWRNSSREELSLWFAYWDTDDRGQLDLGDFQFAISKCLYQAMGDSVDKVTKETVVLLFLEETGTARLETITRAVFLDVLAPTLKANLPDMPKESDLSARGKPLPPLLSPSGLALSAVPPPMQIFVETPTADLRQTLQVPADGTVADLRKAVRGSTDAELSKLYFAGKSLNDDRRPLMKVRGLHSGATVQAFPDARSSSDCVIS